MAEATEVPMIVDGEPIVDPAIPDSAAPAIPDSAVTAIPDSPAIPDSAVTAIPDSAAPAIPDSAVTAIPDSAATEQSNGGEKRGREEAGEAGAEAEREENGSSKKLKAETPAEEEQIAKAAETPAEEEQIAKAAAAETPAEEEQIAKAAETAETPVQEEQIAKAAEEQIAKAAEEQIAKASEMKEGEEEPKDGDVSLGPKNFKSALEMFNYFFKFLHFWVPNLDINEYEHMVLLDLLKKGHAEHEKKIGEGVQAFQVRYHPTYKSRCFFLVRVNGSSDDFSFRKCVNSILPLPENLKLPSSSDGKMGGGGHGGGGGWRGRGGGRGGRGRGRRGGRN